MVSLNDVLLAMSNIPVDDPIAEIWGRGLQRGYEIIEYTGTLPITITTDGTALIDYCIYGNTVQNGTPTPENPVDVVGCGVRTENVMPAGEKKTVEVNGVTFSSDGNGCYHISGTASQDTKVHFNLVPGFTTPVSVSNGGQGTLSLFNDKECSNVRLVFCNGSTEIDDWGLSPKNRTNTKYNLIGNKYVDSIRITVSAGAPVDVTIMPEFTDDGILPSEFEPYGYKLPLTVNGTEYPIYFGEAETTRRIKKFVLTGEEGWVRTQNQKCYYINASTGCPTDYLKQTITTSICSHYQSQNNTASGSNEIEAGHFCFYTGGGCELYIGETTIPSAADFKTYLQQQYANGTPVTVWYVLKEPKTGIVNEPLMKIGDYADTIDSAQAAMQIQTFAGTTVIDYDGTPKPSQMYIKYRR